MLFQLSVIGRLRIVTREGADLTPTSSRARAMLAILALTPGYAMERRKIEALIWSDSTPKHASQSSRTALSGIRKAFGPHEADIWTRGDELRLNADAVWIDLFDAETDALSRLTRGQELLEAMDIGTDAFEDWLREKRSWVEGMAADRTGRAEASIANGAGPQLPVLLTEIHGPQNRLESFVSNAICDRLARNACEFHRLEVVQRSASVLGGLVTSGAYCRVSTLIHSQQAHVIVTIIDMRSGACRWSQSFNFEVDRDLVDLDVASALATEASEIIVKCSHSDSAAARANVLTASATRDIFSFEDTRLLGADAKLAEALEQDRNPICLALRALLRAFLLIERLTDDPCRVVEEIETFYLAALAEAEGNALVLGLLADVADLAFDRVEDAYSLASRAVRLNPSCGYAWGALGTAQLRQGRHQEALASTARAQRILRRTAFFPWSEMRFALAAIGCRQFTTALMTLRELAPLAPRFRPLLRHSYVLNLAAGDHRAAEADLAKLRLVEPDVSPKMLREDGLYPLKTIRDAGLAEVIPAQ